MTPTIGEVLDNCRVFVAHELRQRYYTWASKVVAEALSGNVADMGGLVGGIMILEYSWNDMFYADGLFDQDRLAQCLERHVKSIQTFRATDLTSPDATSANLADLFVDFLESLANRSSHLRSPVSVGKCLHLLCPRFFPLWDSHIAEGTGYHWGRPVVPGKAARSYADFMEFNKRITEKLIADLAKEHNMTAEQAARSILSEYERTVEKRAVPTTMLKMMDEYLYVEHTHPEWK